jgi:hypothetical protein
VTGVHAKIPNSRANRRFFERKALLGCRDRGFLLLNWGRRSSVWNIVTNMVRFTALRNTARSEQIDGGSVMIKEEEGVGEKGQGQGGRGTLHLPPPGSQTEQTSGVSQGSNCTINRAKLSRKVGILLYSQIFPGKAAML